MIESKCKTQCARCKAVDFHLLDDDGDLWCSWCNAGIDMEDAAQFVLAKYGEGVLDELER